MSAIRATYSDVKLVKTRKVFQLIFEVPIEEADNALRVLGGMPRPDAEIWVGIAPITEEAATRAPDKPRKRMADLSRAQQAGILCNEPRFQQFAERVHYCVIPEAEEPAIIAAEFVRDFCEVTSRAELNSDKAAGLRWDNLRSEYDAWRGAIGRPDDNAR